jgi:hypothetical protein
MKFARDLSVHVPGIFLACNKLFLTKMRWGHFPFLFCIKMLRFFVSCSVNVVLRERYPGKSFKIKIFFGAFSSNFQITVVGIFSDFFYQKILNYSTNFKSILYNLVSSPLLATGNKLECLSPEIFLRVA